MHYSAEGHVSSGCTGTVPVLLYHVTKVLKMKAFLSFVSGVAKFVAMQREIASLTSAVEQLRLENAKLRESLGAAQSQVCASQADGKTKRNYASAISSA